MAGKSFFSKLFSEDEGETVEEIDRRLAEELAEIDAQEVETLDGDGMILDDWEKALRKLIRVIPKERAELERQESQHEHASEPVPVK